jgi:hypothetical protein
MAEILVEENFVRIDGGDMNALLNILDRIGIEAEPTAPRHDDGGDHGGAWTLAVHWLNAGPVAPAADAAFPAAFAQIRAHFADAGKLPPSRVLLYGADDSVLRTYTPDRGAA